MFKKYPVSIILFILFTLLSARLIQAGVDYKDWAALPENRGHTIGNEGGQFALMAVIPLGILLIFIICLCGVLNKKDKSIGFYAAICLLIVAEEVAIYYATV